MDCHFIQYYSSPVLYGIPTENRYSHDVVDVDHALAYNGETPAARSMTTVSDVPMPVTLSEIIAAQKTDDFCQTVIATMGHAKSFFFEGEDGVLRLLHPSIPELEQIVVPETLPPCLLHLSHHTNVAGNPGRTRMFAHLRWTI